MHRTLHPATWACIILFFFVVALCGSLIVQLCGVASLLIANAAGEKRKKMWRKIALYILPVACLLVAVNYALGIPLSQGIAYALRFLLLILPLLTAVHFVSPGTVSIALRAAPVPSRIQYLFFFSLEIIQTLREVFQNVYVAQQLRGFRVERSYVKRWRNIFPLLLPVTLIAISQNLDRSLAFDFKGIESAGPKSYLRTLPFSRLDRAAMALLLLSSIFLVFAAVVVR